MSTCCENLHHTQEFQKQAYNRRIKPGSYVPGDKVWLNSKYIKIKQNRKLEAKFFDLFQVLYSVGKQAYKLELLKKWRIHEVFHMFLLEWNITKKGQVDENVTQLEFEVNDVKKFEVKSNRNNNIYIKELEAGHLLGLYYLISLKDYSKKKNI